MKHYKCKKSPIDCLSPDNLQVAKSVVFFLRLTLDSLYSRYPKLSEDLGDYDIRITVTQKTY